MKQVILLRSDIKMSSGKKIVQACHASVGALLKVSGRIINKWNVCGSKKVVLVVQDAKKLKDLFEDSKKLGLPCFLVADAGLTELKPGTITALAIGPAESKKIDKLTGNIKLL